MLHVQGTILTGPREDDVRDELWVIDGKITFTKPTSTTDITTISGYVLPGLVDAHCHVGLDADGPVDDQTSIQQATIDRDSGALLLRDAGSPADTRFIDEHEELPEIIRAGQHIARPKRYIRNYATEVEPADLAATMAAQARAGDGWVKIVGDWIDRGTGDLGQLWPFEAAEAGIAAAHAEGARVTAHCFAEETLVPLVEAGIDCIEHATGLTEDSIDLFAERGVAIVPTLINILTFPHIADMAAPKFPIFERHIRDLYECRYQTIGAAHEAGVKIYTGTDAGGDIAHGRVPDEVAELIKVGMTNMEALDAATWGAREWMGRDAIAEGARADFVVYSADPRVDVAVLADPHAIVLRGKEISRAA